MVDKKDIFKLRFKNIKGNEESEGEEYIDENIEINFNIDAVKQKEISEFYKVDRFTYDEFMDFEVSFLYPTIKRQYHILIIETRDITYFISVKEVIRRFFTRNINIRKLLDKYDDAEEKFSDEIIEYIYENFIKFGISVSYDEDKEAFLNEMIEKVIMKPITISLLQKFPYEIRNKIVKYMILENISENNNLVILSYYAYSYEKDVYFVSMVYYTKEIPEVLNNVISIIEKISGYLNAKNIINNVSMVRVIDKTAYIFYEFVSHEAMNIGLYFVIDIEYMKGKVYFGYKNYRENFVFVNPMISKSFNKVEVLDMDKIWNEFNSLLSDFVEMLDYKIPMTDLVNLVNLVINEAEERGLIKSKSLINTITSSIHYYGMNVQEASLINYIAMVIRNSYFSRYKGSYKLMNEIENYISLFSYYFNEMIKEE